MLVIVKKTRLYLGGEGYAGPTCQQAGVFPGKIYADMATACIDCAKLSRYNPVGFRVEEYKEPDNERLPR